MLRAALWASFAFVAGGAIAFGCQKVDERPAYIDTQCEAGAKCGEPSPVGVGNGGSSGGGGDAEADASGGVEISGSVIAISSDDLTSAIPFFDPASIEVESPSGAIVSGAYDGDSFLVSGALQSTGTWATVRPTFPGDALPTLQPVDTTIPSGLQLLVLQRSVLELIYGVLTTPTAPADGSAQLVLTFLNAATGQPLQGVSVFHDAAEVIAYDAGGSYTEEVTQTGPRGIALVVNVPAVSQRATQKIQIQTATTSGTLELVLQAGSVTLTDVLIEP